MELPPWGQLPKSQIDPEKIEEAIARMIASHNNDPEAHTAEGQSLYSHKTSEVIQHAVESIIADKIAKGAVQVEKLSWEKHYIHTDFESFDAWEKGSSGIYTPLLGGSMLQTTNVANKTAWIESIPWFDALRFTKNPQFQIRVKISYVTNEEAYVTMGACPHLADTGDDCFGFKFLRNKLYAYNRYTQDDETYQQQTEITGITLTDANTYRAVMTSGQDIKFYINDVLKATVTNNLPNSNLHDVTFSISIKSLAAENEIIAFGSLYAIWDF